jgi:hypothetical protein
MKGIVNEKLKFSQAEQSSFEEDNSRRGRMARWIANHRILSAVMLGSGSLVAGVGVKAAISALNIGTKFAGPIGFAAGMAMKMLGAGRHAALSRAKLIRDFEKRSNEDNQNLLEKVSSLNINSAADAGALATQATGLVSENISDRAKKDVIKNRSDVAGAAIFAGVIGLVGVGLGEIASIYLSPDVPTGGGGLLPKPPTGIPNPTDLPGGKTPSDVGGEFRRWLFQYSQDFYEKNGINPNTASASDKLAAAKEAMKALGSLGKTNPADLAALSDAVSKGTNPLRLFDGTSYDNLYGFFGGSAK